MSIRKAGKIIAGAPRETGGVEIGDIGFAPLGIDESLNLRRYLNGQVISQSQFASFTNKIKATAALFPSLSTTETNWQAEKTNSKLGQCGKFVVDDTAGTIRLPCVVNAQGLTDLQYLGTIKSESLPNISGVGGIIDNTNVNLSGVFEAGGTSNNFGLTGSTGRTCTTQIFNASRSSSAYQDNAPVQQEAVQYPYYIQVATGVEETLPAIREYKVNNSDFFGKSMYSDVAPNNASWLVSNGQWNAKSVYPDYYNWLLDRMNNGVEGVLNSVMYAYSPSGSAIIFTLTTTNPKVGMTCYGWTDGSYTNIPISTIASVNQDGTFVAAYNGTDYTFERNSAKDQSQSYPTDYDWVVNTADETFRLPLLDGEENLTGSVNELIGSDSIDYTLPKNGTVKVRGVSASSSRSIVLAYSISASNGDHAYSAGTAIMAEVHGKKGDLVHVAVENCTDVSVHFTPAVGNGSLYYYVGDTVQDASLINAGAVLGQLANKADIDASNFNASGKSLLSGLGMPSNRYIDLTLGASGSTYTAPANGYVVLEMVGTQKGQNGYINSPSNFHGTYYGGYTPDSGRFGFSIIYPVTRGEVFTVVYSYTEPQMFRFFYAEGEQ